MSRVAAVGLVLLLAACGRTREYVAPAPAGALDCALREAREMGYSRMEGANAENFVRVSQRVELPQEHRPEGRDPLPGPDAVRPVHRDQPMYNELILREERGQLRIQVVGQVRGTAPVPADRDAEGHAQRILAACTTGG